MSTQITLPAIMPTPYMAKDKETGEQVLCMAKAREAASDNSIVIYGILNSEVSSPNILYMNEESFYEKYEVTGPANFNESPTGVDIVSENHPQETHCGCGNECTCH